MNSLGKKIAELRREKGMTQEELSERLGVSPQAVSKWENDVSCPDIMLLPRLAEVFSVTVDALLSVESQNKTMILPEEKRKSLDELMLRVYVNSAKGDRVKVNLPMPLVKLAIEMGMSMPEVSGNDALKNIDLERVLLMVEQGLIGKLVEVESADGDNVEVVVE